MHRHRWMVLWLLIGLPTLLWAENLSVVVHGDLVNQPQLLERMGFQLRTRVGEQLIGTLPSGLDRLPEGVTRLSVPAENLSDLYILDDRSAAQAPEAAQMLTVIYAGTGWALVQANPGALNALSSAGVHFRAVGTGTMRPQAPLPPGGETDVIHPYVGVILSQVSSASYQNYLQTLQDFVSRNTYNASCDSAANWIRQTFQSFGLTATIDSFQIGAYTKFNIIAEKPGTSQPNQVYFMTAHYDATAGLPIFPEASAPGADDDASGAAAVLECARVVAQNSFTRTVRFVLFAGNEQGLIGSEDYVAGLPTTQTYLGSFNADMIGYSGADPWPPDLVVYHNGTTGSAALAGKIAEASNAYASGFLQTIQLSDAQMIYSDHAPFWDRNIPAISAMEDEAWGDDLNPFYHSVNDLVTHLDMPYALDVMKVLLASLADLAIPLGSPGAVLTAANPAINDSLGNGNHQLEYGEFVYMALPIVNAGNSGATGVNVTLSENDPYLTIVDNQQFYGNIAALDTVTIYNAFSADVSDTVPDEHPFALTAHITAGSSQWQSQVLLVAHAPNLTVTSVTVYDSISGNENGVLEPGETADVAVTLLNEGSWQAIGLTATISSGSAFVIIQTPTQSYGTLTPGSGSTRSYRLMVTPNAPLYFQADFDLDCTVSGGWRQTCSFSLMAGDPTLQPTGPDAYGYMAYESGDAPFGQPYAWVEIDPGQGGPGTELDFTNGDQTLYVNLPFTLNYYGQEFSEISVNSNGWIACGHTTNTTYLNTNIPNPYGPSAMIAGFWDDLQPNVTGSVSVYYDSLEGCAIVEFYDVRHYNPSTAHETFQYILYDPAIHSTLTGDGEILLQYNLVALSTSCTIGIENPSQTMGIQYLYNDTYASTAGPVDDGKAILFTTGRYIPQVEVTLTPVNPPIQIPASGGNFNFTVALANNDTIAYNVDAWCDITLPNGSPYGPMLGPVNLTMNPALSISRLRNQAVPGAAPAGTYFYNAYAGDYPAIVWSTDAFMFTKLGSGNQNPGLGDWACTGELFPGEQPVAASIPSGLELGISPNPFNPAAAIRYQLSVISTVSVKVYDTAGRLVATLVEGQQEAGTHTATFDGSKLASGIYFVRLQAGEFKAVRKLVLLK
jgi:Zn-dependent M28 family amino/carboxypeptidase